MASNSSAFSGNNTNNNNSNDREGASSKAGSDAKEILINATPQETRIALLQNKRVAEFFFERNADKGIIGNIYKGKVVRVLPGMQAAFVDIGVERAAFLYAGDFVKNSQNVEDMDDDESDNADVREHRRRRQRSDEIPPIAQLVREGQEILVQVAKGPIGTKGARLTCHVSLPGRNLVFMPTLKHNGVSRKIESYEQRRRLKKIIDQYRTKEGGFIVRTAVHSSSASSINHHERQIRADADYLLNLWKKVTRKFQQSAAPKLLHFDLDLTTRVIRDFLDDDIERMVVDSPVEHRRILKFIRNFNPALREKVELYEDDTPLFDKYHVETEINKALGKRVWLKSGGYLIIETTEALTSIDVNTGRFVGKKTLEETILKTNLESAEEIVKQLRLRNLGGIIIIDFIDMERDSSKEQVYRFLDQLLREDKSKTTALKISNLGLVEMTRKRSRESVHRYLTEQCAVCEGKGFVKSKVALAHQALRDMRRELPTLEADHLYVALHPEIENILKSHEQESIIALEKAYQKGIRLVADPALHIEQIVIQGVKPAQPGRTSALLPLDLQPKAQPRNLDQDDEDENDEGDYQNDLAAIQAAKDAKAKAIADAAAAQSVDDEDVSDEPDLAAMDAPEIDAPIIRQASADEVEDDEEDDEDDAEEDSELSAESTTPPTTDRQA